MSGRKISQRLTQRLRRLEVRRTCRFEALACAPVVQNNRKINLSSTSFRQRTAARRDGPSPSGTRPAHSRRVAAITPPAGRSVERVGARARTASPQPSATDEGCCLPRYRLRHRIRGRPSSIPKAAPPPAAVKSRGIATMLSIGVGSGPQIGIQEGPLRFTF